MTIADLNQMGFKKLPTDDQAIYKKYLKPTINTGPDLYIHFTFNGASIEESKSVIVSLESVEPNFKVTDNLVAGLTILKLYEGDLTNFEPFWVALKTTFSFSG